MSSNLTYILSTEQMTGGLHPSLPDTLNRALRVAQSKSGIDPDAAFPGFAAVFNPMAYGAIGDDTADDTAAIQAAISAAGAASPTGEVLINKKYKVSATANVVPGSSGNYALLVPTGVSIRFVGIGRLRCVTDAATVIAAAGASSASHVTDVTLIQPRIVGGDVTNNGLGRGIFFFRADRCSVIGGDISAVRLGVQFDRLSSDAAYNLGNRVVGTVVHDTFGTAVGNGTGFFCSGCDGLTLDGIHALNVAEHGLYISQNMRNLSVSGVFRPAVNTNGNVGVQIFTAIAVPDIDSVTLHAIHCIGGKYGVLASSGGGGGFITNLTVAASTATGCLTNGLVFSGVKDATVDMRVTGTTAGNGIEADSSVRVHFVGSYSSTNANHGLILVGSTDCQILGGSYLNNDQSGSSNGGIRLAGASTGAKIAHALCTDDQGVKTQDYGIIIDAAASNADITGCTVSGNQLGPFATFGATGCRIRNCRGYNPVGPATVAPGASPYTYTAGTSPETIHIFGGTVSSVTKGGVALASATNLAVQLEPNEALVVTYTVAPSVSKDVH